MKLAFSFAFLILFVSSAFAQNSTEEKIKILKSHNWRISTVAIKYRDSTEFKWLKPYDVEPCFYEAVFNFNSKFNLLQDFAKECTLDEQGFAKWKFDEKGRLVLFDTGDYLDYVLTLSDFSSTKFTAEMADRSNPNRVYIQRLYFVSVK